MTDDESGRNTAVELSRSGSACGQHCGITFRITGGQPVASPSAASSRTTARVPPSPYGAHPLWAEKWLLTWRKGYSPDSHVPMTMTVLYIRLIYQPRGLGARRQRMDQYKPSDVERRPPRRTNLLFVYGDTGLGESICCTRPCTSCGRRVGDDSPFVVWARYSCPASFSYRDYVRCNAVSRLIGHVP